MKMNELFSKFIYKKISLAEKIYNGENDGGYNEIVLIFSAVLSSIASEMWPGKNIDRKRFVELLVKYTPFSLKAKYISIPVLWQKFIQINDFDSQIILEKKYNLKGYQLLTDEEIDSTEDYIFEILPKLTEKEIRKYSYAQIFYEYVRSPIIHEYQISDSADQIMVTQRDVLVSYNNTLIFPYKRIYFHFRWMKEITTSLIERLNSFDIELPSELPIKWWIDG